MFKIKMLIAVLASSVVIGCTTTSGVIPRADGSYMMMARAAPVRGGAEGATVAAFKAAQAFCVGKGMQARLLSSQDRDVYQRSFGGGWNRQGGSLAGSQAAAGMASIVFSCVR